MKKWLKRAWFIPAIVYLVLVVADIVSLANGTVGVHEVIKPFLMPVLAVTALFMFLAKSVPLPIIFFLIVALVFHTIGDIFLINPDPLFLKWGLLAFFVGHLFYIIILRSNQRQNNMDINPISITRIIIYVIICIGIPALIAYFAHQPKPMTIYIFLYGWVLFTVAYKAARCQILGVPFAWLVFLGAVLFIISDSLLAMDEFMNIHIPYHPAIIMLTYALAQWFIVYGISNFYKDAKELAD